MWWKLGIGLAVGSLIINYLAVYVGILPNEFPYFRFAFITSTVTCLFLKSEMVFLNEMEQVLLRLEADDDLDAEERMLAFNDEFGGMWRKIKSDLVARGIIGASDGFVRITRSPDIFTLSAGYGSSAALIFFMIFPKVPDYVFLSAFSTVVAHQLLLGIGCYWVFSKLRAMGIKAHFR